MKSFKNYEVLTEAKNTHMTHIEDLVLDGGVKGARQAILALRSLRDMLSPPREAIHLTATRPMGLNRFLAELLHPVS